MFMCKQLNLEDSVSEIQHEFGMSDHTRISFNDFLRCRARVLTAAQEGEDGGMDSDTSGIHTHQPHITSWPTMSSDSLGTSSSWLSVYSLSSVSSLSSDSLGTSSSWLSVSLMSSVSSMSSDSLGTSSSWLSASSLSSDSLGASSSWLSVSSLSSDCPNINALVDWV